MESSYAFAKKKDNNLSLFINYRELNKVTMKNRFPLSHIYGPIDQLQGLQVSRKIDPKTRYHQLKIKLEDVQKTTF